MNPNHKFVLSLVVVVALVVIAVLALYLPSPLNIVLVLALVAIAALIFPWRGVLRLSSKEVSIERTDSTDSTKDASLDNTVPDGEALEG